MTASRFRERVERAVDDLELDLAERAARANGWSRIDGRRLEPTTPDHWVTATGAAIPVELWEQLVGYAVEYSGHRVSLSQALDVLGYEVKVTPAEREFWAGVWGGGRPDCPPQEPGS